MSFIDKNTKETSNIINKNNGMRNVIYEAANNIEFLIKEYYKEQKKLKSKKDNLENECLNSKLLNDLPINQQIELYKECINELNKESPELKANRIEIENLNNKIAELKLKIYEEKQINTSLSKMNINYTKILNNISSDKSLIKQENKEIQLKELTKK